MNDFTQMMETQIKQMHAEFEKTIASALEQQKSMNEEMGFETTEEDRQELIAQYKQQAEMQESMMRQQMAMQESMMAMMAAYDDGTQPDMAVMNKVIQAMNDKDDEDEDDDEEEMTEEELQEFLDEHPVPEEMKKHLMIGALLIGTNGEPYTSLALIGDKDDFRELLEDSWGIEGREDALEMLESLYNGRHSEQFKDDYSALKKHGAEGYFENIKDPIFDEGDIDTFNTVVEAIGEILNLSEQAENCVSLYAWDVERIGLLARTLSHVGFITEKEAYDWLKKAGAKAAETFKTWEDYVVSILLGRALHMGISQEAFIVACDLFGDSKYLFDTYSIDSLK